MEQMTEHSDDLAVKEFEKLESKFKEKYQINPEEQQLQSIGGRRLFHPRPAHTTHGMIH